MKATFTCPICQKNVHDLKAHKARMHPENPDPAPDPAPDPESSGQTLEIKPLTGGEQETGYHCTACGGALTKGQNPCPHCGESLAWEALDG